MTVERCGRRWWFEKVAELRVPNSKPQSFGHALHRACAAFLMDTNMPKGWADDITDREIEVIMDFVDQAIRRKVLAFRPGLSVEHDFRMPVGAEEMHGVIDVLDVAGGVVEDHKLIAAARWARTAADLRTDIPMMIYGGFLLQQAPHEQITLRHNQFIQEDMSVRHAQATVSRIEVREFWRTRVFALLNTMDKARGVEQWSDVPGHDRLSDACTAYGGCPFSVICHKGLPIEEFQGCGDQQNGAPF